MNYDEREKEAIECYVASSFYELAVLKTLTVPVRAMTIKVYSLYALHEKEGDADSLHRDISFISNIDIVFLMTNYFNHPFYYKLMNEMEKNPKVKMVYLTGYPNLERKLNEMVELAEA